MKETAVGALDRSDFQQTRESMNDQNEMKKYESFKIPDRKADQKGGSVQPSVKTAVKPLAEEIFYDIEYDATPVAGVAKSVLMPQKIEDPEKNPLRKLFQRMKDIARNHRSTYDYSRFFDRRIQNDNAIIFYQQGIFMQDFADDYSGNSLLSQYFPNYQMMSYEQLRTYFTWRTQVRKGVVPNTSLSFVFLYIYELLENIGVTDSQDGINKLIFVWQQFREYDTTIDRYVLRWIKDYYVYYDLPISWAEFLAVNKLSEYYPHVRADDTFDLFCSLARYDIRKSVFYNDATRQMINDCFLFVIKRIRQEFESAGIHFDNALFRPTKKLIVWRPFRDALFYSHLKQRDRYVILAKNEIYICRKNAWTSSVNLTTEKGRQFIGYVMKQMESSLRKINKFKFKLSANKDMINEHTIQVLNKAGLSPEKIVTEAVLEYHREATKTIVSVDPNSLERIRREALVTQEALIVEEGKPILTPASNTFTAQDQDIFFDPAETEEVADISVWEDLKRTMSETEINTLTLVLKGDDIKAFADKCGIMLEVLVDGINEKALDYIGDNLLDEDFVLYDDYKEQVKELVK